MAEQADDEGELDTQDIDDAEGQDSVSNADRGEDTQSGEDEDQIEGDEPEDEVTVITFGDEAAPASDEKIEPDLIRKLRAEIRKRDADLLIYRKGDQPQKIEIGEKPTLESCDYDEAKYDDEVDAWKDRKAEAERQTAEVGKQGEAQRAAFAEDLATFGRQKQALKVRDFDIAEEAVVTDLSQVQQAIVVQAAENSAAVIYALGRHPAKLATLAAIDNPIKFAVAVAKLEGQLKVTTKSRKAPEVDTPVRGSGQLSTRTDKALERLEKEAERTNDRTKVVQYKRKLKAQGRS